MQHSNTVIEVKVPASTANLGPGFDTIGLAFQLYTTIQMRFADHIEVISHSEELKSLPKDQNNLIYRVAADLFVRAGLPEPKLAIDVYSDIPLTRGLGSSAAAIVGGLIGANYLAGEPFTPEQLFSLAAQWEGHPDNVGASLFGGIVVATMPENPDDPVPFIRLPAPSLHVLVTIPHFHLATTKARSVLPQQYEKEDVVYNIGRSSLLVAALTQGRLDLLKKAMRDRIHQPHRARLVPGLEEIINHAPEHGALGVALSGAGPTILSFYQSDADKEKLITFIDQVMKKHQIEYENMLLTPDSEGAQIYTPQSSLSS
jgi:homoserine kinase